jgi:hypothetical protein
MSVKVYLYHVCNVFINYLITIGVGFRDLCAGAVILYFRDASETRFLVCSLPGTEISEKMLWQQTTISCTVRRFGSLYTVIGS